MIAAPLLGVALMGIGFMTHSLREAEFSASVRFAFREAQTTRMI
jgi:hypothetical protein